MILNNATSIGQQQQQFACNQQQQQQQQSQHKIQSKEDIKPITANLVPKLEAIDIDKAAPERVSNTAPTAAVGKEPPTVSVSAESFFNETLELSQEDIQKTLSANMPLSTTVGGGGGGGSGGGVGSAGVGGGTVSIVGMEPIISDDADINPMDFINNCCDDGECGSSKFNLRADIFIIRNDFLMTNI